MDSNDVILGRPDTSFLVFYMKDNGNMALAFVASNRSFFSSCYQHSFQVKISK